MVVAALSAGQAHAQSPAPTPYPLSTSEVANIQTMTKRELKDPASAVFGSIRAATQPDGAIVVCGWLNAKNSFGGYTGMQPFAGILTKEAPGFLLADIGGERSMAVAIGVVCRRSGVDILAMR